MLTLSVYRGERAVQELDLDGPEISIGRNADNTVVLPDDGKGVSRVHAVLRIENGACVLYDRNSQNGTLMAGKRIKRAVVQPGQDFVIGPYRLVLGASDAVEGEAKPTGTVVAARSTPLEAPSNAVVKAREAAARVVEWVSGQPLTRMYGVGAVLLAALTAVLLWQLWPAPEPQIVQLTTTTTTTTSIPEPPVDPYAAQIEAARTMIDTAYQQITPSQTGQPISAAQYSAAAEEFARAVAEYLQQILSENPAHPEALALQERATTGAAEARKAGAALVPKLAKVTTTIPLFEDPNGVTRRPGESDALYTSRNERAKRDYARGRELTAQEDWLGAVEHWSDLLQREPEFRDVSTHHKLSQEALARARDTALAEGRRLEAAGHAAMTDKRLAEATTNLIAAQREFERALKLQAPEAQKLLAENLERRRYTAKEAFGLGQTHANFKNFGEAEKLIRMVIALLAPGDKMREEAESALTRLKR